MGFDLMYYGEEEENELMHEHHGWNAPIKGGNMTPKIQIEYKVLEDLKKLEDNPRTIKKKDFETLKKSVQDNPDYFEARPLILSDRTGELVIIAGNMRYEAAKALGMEQVPTVTLHDLTEERERTYHSRQHQ